MTKRRIASAPRRFWSSEDDAQLRALYPDTPTVAVARALGRSFSGTYQRAYTLGLHKSAAYLASPAAGRTNGRQGIGTRFTKGHVPANKGVKRPPGWAPGRMRETQFRKGERRGVAVTLYKPIGTERITRDGYLERKVADLNPIGLSREEANRRRQRVWRPVHVLVWEAAHGPVPPSHTVVFVNGDKTDIRLANLACITRRELMQRNSVHNLPSPLPQIVQLLGALNRKINRRTHADAEQDRGSTQPPVRGAGRARGPRQADGARPRESDCGRGARHRGLGKGRSAVPASDRTDTGDRIHRAPGGRKRRASAPRRRWPVAIRAIERRPGAARRGAA